MKKKALPSARGQAPRPAGPGEPPPRRREKRRYAGPRGCGGGAARSPCRGRSSRQQRPVLARPAIQGCRRGAALPLRALLSLRPPQPAEGRSRRCPSPPRGRDPAAPGGDGQRHPAAYSALPARRGCPPPRSASPGTAARRQAGHFGERRRPGRSPLPHRPPGLTCPPQLLHSRGQLRRLTGLLGNGRRRRGLPPARPGALGALQGPGGAQGHGGRRRRRARPRSHAGRGLPVGRGLRLAAAVLSAAPGAWPRSPARAPPASGERAWLAASPARGAPDAARAFLALPLRNFPASRGGTRGKRSPPGGAGEGHLLPTPRRPACPRLPSAGDEAEAAAREGGLALTQGQTR